MVGKLFFNFQRGFFREGINVGGGEGAKSKFKAQAVVFERTLKRV